MNFVSPSFLWCLSFIAIPVIIHLFNFRRFKKIYFTNVKFLKELKEETSSRSQLKHLLVLLSRIFAVSFLVLAFAQPFIPKQKTNNASGQSLVSIYVDNSFSMQALSKEGTLLDEAKQKARDIANAFPQSTQFQLLSNEFSGVQQRIITRDELVGNLDKIKPSSYSHTVNEIIKRQQEAFSSSNAVNKLSYIVSDFQKNTITDNKTEGDTLMQLSLVMTKGNEVNNVFVDSCWLSSPVVQLNQQSELTVRFKNSGNSAAENVPVKLVINGFQKSVTTVNIPANGDAYTKINFTVSQPGWQKAEVSITDNPITFDDVYYFSFNVAEKINIYHISHKNANPFIKTLFTNNPVTNFSYANENSLDFSAMHASNMVVVSDIENISTGLSDELKKFTSQGGTLLVFPDSMLNPSSWKNFLSQMKVDNFESLNNNQNNVQKIELKDELFKDVFEKIADNINLPSVKTHYEISSSSRSNREVLISMQGGSPLLCRYRFGKGTVYLFTVAANEEFSNFVTHALFVPVMTRAALLSVQTVNLAYMLGDNSNIGLKYNNIKSDRVMHLVNKKINFDVIPGVRNSPDGTTIFLDNSVSQPGAFDLTDNDSTLAVLSLNYNRSESYMQFYTEEQLQQKLNASSFKSLKIISSSSPNLTKTIAEESRGISLWKYCILLALLFLGLEIALLRLL
jgi:hypothetical protein